MTTPTPTLADLAAGRRCWMVNVNRKRYDLDAHAAAGETDTWRFDSRHEKARAGDVVLFREGQPSAGLYVVGTVETAPSQGPDSQTGKLEWRAALKFEYVVDPPALRDELLADPVLAGFGPFRGYQGLNYFVPDGVVERLSEMLRGRLHPTSQIDNTLRNARKALRDHEAHVRDGLLDRVRAMSPDDFQRLIGRLLEALGYVDVNVVGRSGDRGIDITAKEPGHLGPALDTIIQVKRFAASNTIGRETVANLRGSRDPGQRAFLVTTSGFTPAAVDEARDEKKEPIILVDGEQLAELLMRHQLGVREVETVTLWEPDSSTLQ
jgi:hypothetical protein